MANKAGINASIEQKALRSVARIKRLDLALAKKGISEERKTSLQAEKDRRLGELKSLNDSLKDVLGNL